MKLLVALAVILVAATAICAFSADRTAQLKGYGKQCYNATHSDIKVINDALKGEFADDPKLEQFFDCVWKKIGLKEDGTFDKDVAARELSYNPTIRDAALKCTDKTGSNPVETLELSSECIKANLPAGHEVPW